MLLSKKVQKKEVLQEEVILTDQEAVIPSFKNVTEFFEGKKNLSLRLSNAGRKEPERMRG